jgi:deoxyguanosine kinase
MRSNSSIVGGSRTNHLNRVEICGGIASGKTTLATVMERAGHHTIFENFKLNPFIEKFYSDSEFYSFETEISFLLQHYSQIKTEARQAKGFFCDYSLLLDSSYAEVTLKPSHLKIFQDVYETVISEILSPNLIIHLRCPAETQLYRIRQRNRSMESGITTQYLDLLNRTLDSTVRLEHPRDRILEIDSEKLDFAHDRATQNEIVKLIQDSFHT